MIDFDVKLPFRMHAGQIGEANVQKHIYLFREQGKGYCPYKLYAPIDRLLPFQIFIPLEEGATTQDVYVNDIFFYDCEGNWVADLFSFSNLNTQIETYQVFGVGAWIVYKGDLPAGGMAWASGYYYMQFFLDSGRDVFSELFYVDCNLDYSRFMKFEFWNTCDFANVIYQNGFKNYMYFDTTLLKKEPTIEETGFENGHGEFQITSSRMINMYKFQSVMPEFMVDALVFMKMHNQIHATLSYIPQTGKFAVKKIGQAWDNDGMLCDVSLELEQEQRLLKGSCCENKIFSSLVPPVAVAETLKLNLDNASYETTGGGFITINGNNYNLLWNDIGFSVQVAPSSVGTFATTAGGEVTIFANGNFRYKKPAMYWGGGSAPYNDSFVYTIIDPYGSTSSTTINLVVDFVHAVQDNIQCNPLIGVNPIKTGFLLTNDHIPVDYVINPVIYPNPYTVVSGKITIYSGNPSCIGNYIEIDIYTGAFTYYNVASVNSNFIFDLFTYRIWKSVGNLSAPVNIVIAF